MSTPNILPAFPGAEGWAKYTPGGRGGQIIRVTTLTSSGSGSFLEAVQTSGSRIIVFEVGGVIDLNFQTIKIGNPFITIAGQTAPSPGITLIKGGILIKTHDVIIRHIRVRPGQAGRSRKSRWEPDAITTSDGAHNVIVDHCSLSWAIDENLSASGPRFQGQNSAEWEQNTSHDITFSNNIIAEGLCNSSHSKGEHSMGTLIHDNCNHILVLRNLYAHNKRRNPLIKGGAQCVIANNYIYNPGRRAIQYNLVSEEWNPHPFQTGVVVLFGNVLQAGLSTDNYLERFMVSGSGKPILHARDNISVDCVGNPLPIIIHSTAVPPQIIQHSGLPPLLPQGLIVLRANTLQDILLSDVGACPWDRDANNNRIDVHDNRIIYNVLEGNGRIIDCEDEVGGYPNYTPTYQAFDPTAWDLNFMTRI